MPDRNIYDCKPGDFVRVRGGEYGQRYKVLDPARGKVLHLSSYETTSLAGHVPLVELEAEGRPTIHSEIANCLVSSADNWSTAQRLRNFMEAAGKLAQVAVDGNKNARRRALSDFQAARAVLVSELKIDESLF